jgi:E3 ubiquitin-protein ligase MUL1
VRLRQIPQYDDFERLERDLRALAADAPGASSRRGRGHLGGAALATRDGDAATGRRAPSLRVALVGRAAADEADLVTCAYAVMDASGGHERERGGSIKDEDARGASPTLANVKRGVGSSKPVRAIFVDATSEHHLARQTARHGEWLRDAQVVAAAKVECPRWRLEDKRGNFVVMHDASSFGELSDAARKNDWSLIVAHDRFEPAGGGSITDGSSNGGNASVSVSGRILANLLDANLGLHVLGVRTRERILAPGATLTAVGEAVLEPIVENTSKTSNDVNTENRNAFRVRFRKPTPISRSRSKSNASSLDAFTVTNKSFESFVSGFGRAADFFHVASVVCFAFGFGLTLHRVVRRRVIAVREKKFRQRLADAEARRLEDGEQPLSELQPPGETCVVCLYGRATACYKECGHLVCCEACASRMQRCPLCRKRSAWMKVYRAGG